MLTYFHDSTWQVTEASARAGWLPALLGASREGTEMDSLSHVPTDTTCCVWFRFSVKSYRLLFPKIIHKLLYTDLWESWLNLDFWYILYVFTKHTEDLSSWRGLTGRSHGLMPRPFPRSRDSRSVPGPSLPERGQEERGLSPCRKKSVQAVAAPASPAAYSKRGAVRNWRESPS